MESGYLRLNVANPCIPFRLIRKIDIMLVNSLVGLGEEACKLAFSELVAYRRQGLFTVTTQFSGWSESHTDPSSNTLSPGESFRYVDHAQRPSLKDNKKCYSLFPHLSLPSHSTHESLSCAKFWKEKLPPNRPCGPWLYFCVSRKQNCSSLVSIIVLIVRGGYQVFSELWRAFADFERRVWRNPGSSKCNTALSSHARSEGRHNKMAMFDWKGEDFRNHRLAAL